MPPLWRRSPRWAGCCSADLAAKRAPFVAWREDSRCWAGGRPAGAWGNAAPAPKRRAAKSAATAAAPPPKKKIAKAIAVEKVVLATNIDPTGVGRGGHNAKPKKPIEQHKNRSAPAHRTPKHVAANGCNWGLRH